jgi:outer membrane autotransporter protein
VRFFKKEQTSRWAGRSGLAVAAAAALICLNASASAQNATWRDFGSNWETGANWTPGTVPTGVATFEGAVPLNPTIASNVLIGETNFSATAGAYSVFVLGSGSLTFYGAGVTNNSANTQTFNNVGAIQFIGTSSAGTNTQFNNQGTIEFNFSSTAGSASIENTGSASLSFNANSTAANATIINREFATVAFFGNATGGTATFTNEGALEFNGNSSAGFATINNQTGASFTGELRFNENSSAGNATIVNNGNINFNGASTAANANITNNSSLVFNNTSTAGNAQITNNGAIDFLNQTTAGTATITNDGVLSFRDLSSAANANITNNAALAFADRSTAGSATINNAATGIAIFGNRSTAGSANITNSGFLIFINQASAGSANILINANAGAGFDDRTTAGNAFIINNSNLGLGGLIFDGRSTAANATIVTNGGGYTRFLRNSTGGDARFTITGNGIVDFSDPTATAGAYITRTAGSIEGSGIYAIGGIDFTVGSNNLSTTVTGVITNTAPSCGCGTPNDPGNLIKLGTGTLTLNGVNTYTGFTEVQAGALVINGSISSNTTVFANAMLGGTGAIFGNLTVNAGGILSPGNSVGTFTVNGNATFNNMTYRVEVEPGTSDRTNVTGTVTINGGTVQVTGTNANYGQVQTTVIINGIGGVSGTFAAVTENFAFYDASLSYDPNNVYLTLTRNLTTFTDVALTPNQRAVGNALNATANDAALLQLILGLSPEQARAAFDLLSGEIFATLSGMFIDESAIFRNAIFSRLRNTAFTGFTGPLGYLSEQDDAALAYTNTNRNNAFRALRPANRGYEYWSQAFGSWAKYDSDSNAASAKRSTGGIIAGFDKMQTDDIRAGLSAGYANTQVRVADRGSKANADTFHFAAYLSKLDGRWSFRTGAAIAAHNVNSERSVLGTTLQADYFAATGQIFGEVGYAIAARQFALEPFANVALVHHHTDRFFETGGVAALNTNGFDNTLGFSTLGLRIATRHDLANGWALLPRAMIGWQHAYGDLAPIATLNFQNTGTGMSIAGTPLSRDMLLTEAGFDIRLSSTRMLGFFYSATVASDSNQQTVRGRYEWKF